MVALETGTTPPPTGSSRLSSSTVLFVAALGAFLAFLDVTIVNVAFPNIRESFPGTSIGELSWVLNAYNIVLAASMVACGRLADLIGRRRLYITGLTVFVVASVLCATSGSVLWLVLARVVQAFGAAMLIPASLALVIDAFSSSRRAHAVGLWGASAAVAAGLGPPIGGALVEWGGWRWAFLVNVPVGLVALVAARRSLVESRSPGRRRMPDLRGALALAVALALLTTAITNGHDWGWSSLAVAFCLVGSAAASVGFVVSSRTHPSPLVDPQLLRVRGFVVANVASTVAGMGFYAYLLTNVLWLQYIWGYDVITSGLALVPAALVAAVVAALLGPVAQRHGYRLVVVPGALVWASAYLWYVVSVGTEPAFLTEWLPGQVLSGIGVGATLPLLGSASMASVPGGGYATASAVNASVRQLGGVLGIALLVVIIGDPGPLDAEQAFRHGWVFAAGCFVTAAAISIALGRPGTQDPTVEHWAEGDTHGQITVPDPSPVAPAGHSPLARAPLMSQLTSGARRELEESAEEVQVPAGQTLFAAGDVADAAYSVVSGRLEVDVDGSAVRLLGPGAVIGELALLTSGTRSATVRARRDSVLLRLRPASLLTVMERHPGAGGAVARVLADQLAHPASAPRRREASRTVAVVGLHRNAPTAGVAAALTTCLAPHGRVASPGPVDGAGLARAERDHEVVLLLAADPESDPAWWANAVRQADRVIAVATTALRPTDARPALPAGCDLVLVGTGIPEADRVTWVAALDAWQVTCVSEVSPTSLRALAARTGGRSLGLALAGGGARALTHVGLLAALEEADVPVDRVSGCSVGGIVAGLHASGMSSSEMKETVYAEFVRRKPFSDYTVPRTSLAKGQRVRAALERAFGERTIEGLPGQLRCVSTDLLARTVHVHRRGSVVDALRATTALPGLFPPVVMDGRLLVDGGVLANLPFAPLLERDEGQVVAVNVSMGGADGTKSRRDPSRPPRVPLLGETLLRTMLIGSGGATAGATAAGLVVVTPPSLGVGLLEFHQFDAMYDAGLATGRQLVAAGGLPS